MFPDEPTDEERAEELPEDYDTPFRPATPSQGQASTDESQNRPTQDDIDDTHPATDTNISPQEMYNEGVSGAAEASEPNSANKVVDYNPKNDKNRGKK